MSDSDRKQFDTQNALINLTGSIYAEMRMNRTLDYLRNIAKGDIEAEEISEDVVEGVKGDDDLPAEDSQAAPDDVEDKELENNESDMDEGEVLSRNDEEVESEQENAE
jgi:hypothetical protein